MTSNPCRKCGKKPCKCDDGDFGGVGEAIADLVEGIMDAISDSTDFGGGDFS